MRYILYSRPTLEDLSQGSRIRFIRNFRHLSQGNVSEDLGITGENNLDELVSGHRRKLALKILNVNKVEVEIKELSDDEAIIYIVDSNLCREEILTSKKAFAYKMKLEAIKHQGKRTCILNMSKSSELVGKENNER